MTYLAIIPTEYELNSFLGTCENLGLEINKIKLGLRVVAEIPQLGITIASGGLGKTQFGIQTQYYIGELANLVGVFCIGSAGALSPDVSIGDIVVATETVEHDIRKFGKPMVPRFRSDPTLVNRARETSDIEKGFTVHYGPIASGDEDVFAMERKIDIQSRTSALAVAWEGAGGARACTFSRLPFVEIRGITDSAEKSAPGEFAANFEKSMSSLSRFMIRLAMRKNRRTT